MHLYPVGKQKYTTNYPRPITYITEQIDANRTTILSTRHHSQNIPLVIVYNQAH
jgi:hypothetical protein